MLRVTKIFRFETAHAIHGYNGSCRNIHGHSYVLHVTVEPRENGDAFLAPPGFVIDFKELKKVVNEYVVDQLDHAIVLSETYMANHPELGKLDNLIVWQVEPTAENILLMVRDILNRELPADVVLRRLKIFETADSYAEWEA